ncbi:hypothetical protein [Edaphobacter modestus]|uniref:GAF domain-containing protein n=1 Tax=Edaphobacter modestus TaxID=388466 RepID=A0A4Q7YX36_9BACT|nr:hypothetical protein [Edaphobacter modestus]RZU41984.1 hypothetical protein BDD14_3526 [Edaphobacter modestus]
MLTALHEIWPRLAYGTVILGLAGALGVTWSRLWAVRAERDRERRGREEMEAYTRLDVRMMRNSDLAMLGRRVCGVIAARSAFRRVALLARDGEGPLYIAASEGLDSATVGMVERWLGRMREEERIRGGRWGEGVRIGAGSMVISLGSDERGSNSRAILVPVTTTGEHMAGALLVCADSVMQVRRRMADETVAGLEALAAKLGRAMESTESSDRSRRVERLAGKLVSSRSYPLKVVAANATRLRNGAAAPARMG